MMAPFLSVFLKTSYGVSASLIGALYLTTGMTSLFSAPLAGTLCDRWGRKKILVLSSVVSSVGNVILALVVVFASNVYLFVFLYVVRQILGMWPQVAQSTIVSDVMPSHGQLEVYGLMNAALNAGWAVGSLIGGFFAGSAALVFMISAILGLLPLLPTILYVKETKPKELGPVGRPSVLKSFGDVAKIARDRLVISFLGILSLVSLVWGQFYGLFPLYAQNYVGISSSEMGIAYSLEGVVLAVLSYSASRWAAKFDLISVYRIGIAFFAVATIGVGVMPSLMGIMIFYALIEPFGEMFCGPSSRAIMARLAPEDQRGTYQGVLNLFQRNVHSFAPFIGGVMMDLLGNQFLLFWSIFALLGMIGAILCTPLKKMAKNKFEALPRVAYPHRISQRDRSQEETDS